MSYELAFKLFLGGVLLLGIIIGMYVVKILNPFVEPYVDFITTFINLISPGEPTN
ncbi:MAG: hypothetical protein NPIRA02_02360 [Nitrospirales bacterium]|nr:MAG: hypothetical protein NPIRA02_02360 [Nitrospirales bacterium]